MSPRNRQLLVGALTLYAIYRAVAGIVNDNLLGLVPAALAAGVAVFLVIRGRRETGAQTAGPSSLSNRR